MGFLVGRNGCNSAVCPIGLLGMVCSRLCPYFHYYAFYHYIRHIRWILEFINHAVYTPFILTLPFRLCYVALLWSIILLWYRLQSAAGEREEMENQLVTMQETWMEDRRKAEASRKKEEEAGADAEDCLDRITVKDGTKIHLIELADLLYIQSCGDYIKEQTMKYFETHLPGSDFVRIHRSAIVQVKQISRLELFGKESYQLILKNGRKLKVSNSGYRLLKERLNL